eukprot:TRINITY_DN1632_c4_g1_i1.p1 TRINITY_DN1632_c4_g1~~TRINITY_DN1632_c4_g1_i1.p1  ORF type:complete len:395 (-),score=93.85 TRINITY_DN1632_c4_g1_i1:36-1220(-)
MGTARGFILAAAFCFELSRVFAIRLGRSGPTCASSNDEAAIETAQGMIIAANAKTPMPMQVETRHMVLIAPAKPLDAGDVAAYAFAGLPKSMGADGAPVTEFTKYVVVGFAQEPGPAGISIGNDVCSGNGFSDDDAVNFLKTTVQSEFLSRAPVILNCANVMCQTSVDNLDAQLPMLQAVSNKNLAGNILPILIQKQDSLLGAELGDILVSLVGENGVWADKSVLFVFGSDLSHGLPSALAEDCDERMAKMLAEKTPGEVSMMFADMMNNTATGTCTSADAVPAGRTSLVAALQVADKLGLRHTQHMVSNTAQVLQAKERAALAEATSAVAAGVATASTENATENAMENATGNATENATSSADLKPEDMFGFASVMFWDSTSTVNEDVSYMTPT